MHELGEILARQFESALASTGRLVVAIDGPGCCGKTTLGERLASEMKLTLLETDDFHLPRGAQRSAAQQRNRREELGRVHPLRAGIPGELQTVAIGAPLGVRAGLCHGNTGESFSRLIEGFGTAGGRSHAEAP